MKLAKMSYFFPLRDTKRHTTSSTVADMSWKHLWLLGKTASRRRMSCFRELRHAIDAADQVRIGTQVDCNSLLMHKEQASSRRHLMLRRHWKLCRVCPVPLLSLPRSSSDALSPFHCRLFFYPKSLTSFATLRDELLPRFSLLFKCHSFTHTCLSILYSDRIINKLINATRQV